MNIQLERCLVQVQFLFSHVIPVSNPLVQGRGQSRWTSPEGLGESGRPPRRGCRRPRGRAAGCPDSTRWGCSRNIFETRATLVGRTRGCLKQTNLTAELVFVPLEVIFFCWVHFCLSFFQWNGTSIQHSRLLQALLYKHSVGPGWCYMTQCNWAICDAFLRQRNNLFKFCAALHLLALHLAPCPAPASCQPCFSESHGMCKESQSQWRLTS